MRKAIRHFLNKRGYEIIKQTYAGDKFPNRSVKPNIYYVETPIGNYNLPQKGLERDAVAHALVRGTYFDPEIIDVAKRYIKKGTSVLDVGANFGQMSIEFSKAVGEEGKVYSFEAQNIVFDLLKKNLEANNCGNVQPFRNAVWEKDGDTFYFPEPDMDSPAPYSGNAITAEKKLNPVQTLTIDSLNIQEQISFMKIDIEGADIFALRGAKNTIMKHRMPIIFEYTQHMQQEFKTSFEDYVAFARSVNYKFVEVVMGYNYLIVPE